MKSEMFPRVKEEIRWIKHLATRFYDFQAGWIGPYGYPLAWDKPSPVGSDVKCVNAENSKISIPSGQILRDIPAVALVARVSAEPVQLQLL